MTCPIYCPCRVLDRRGEHPRRPEICPREQDRDRPLWELGSMPEHLPTLMALD